MLRSRLVALWVYSFGFFLLYDPLPFFGFIAPPGLLRARLQWLGCLGFVIIIALPKLWKIVALDSSNDLIQRPIIVNASIDHNRHQLNNRQLPWDSQLVAVGLHGLDVLDTIVHRRKPDLIPILLGPWNITIICKIKKSNSILWSFRFHHLLSPLIV